MSSTPMEFEHSVGEFEHLVEKFDETRILRYKLSGWEQLSLNEKKLVYYLSMAGLAGRDIFWDQGYRHNLKIRRALEKIYGRMSSSFNLPNVSPGPYDANRHWEYFVEYLKNVWVCSGIHHHSSSEKMKPKFSRQYFEVLLKLCNVELEAEVIDVMFNDEDSKLVSFDDSRVDGEDMLQKSANNFYEKGITVAEVKAYYDELKKKNPKHSVGYNSKLVRQPPLGFGVWTPNDLERGVELMDAVYRCEGMYEKEIQKIVPYLTLARQTADEMGNGKLRDTLALLIEYYQTGDLDVWIRYNISWIGATEGKVDYINGFIENYRDSLGYKGSFESVVHIKDPDMTAQMEVIGQNAQWFEDNSPIMKEHKKENVVGITYTAVNVASLYGDAGPIAMIGINLPNEDWIRTEHGSKSVSLRNIIEAYENTDGVAQLKEFAYDEEEVNRAIKHGSLAANLKTALHEVVGHASGKSAEGVEPRADLKNYYSVIEEARADLVALYYLYDEKIEELGLCGKGEWMEVAKAGYDAYIRNALIIQLTKLKAGDNIEQAHMKNRHAIASWVFNKGYDIGSGGVISRIVRDGKTYYRINDYEALRKLFGVLLREVQKIKSDGRYDLAKEFVESYGTVVDQTLFAEFSERNANLGMEKYTGFMNPELYPVLGYPDGMGHFGEREGREPEIVDVEVRYPESFAEQMLSYSLF